MTVSHARTQFAQGRAPLPDQAAAAARKSLFASNDNAATSPADALVRAALRLFEQHGVEVTRYANAQAERAFFAGERAAFRWWLEVTRTLDRKVVIECH